ncbi:MAG: thiamine phosphate synthase [Ancalomicrobiaceae bacterium]|nr:thiamine phosphate synthase [Ancalomicrobiaceae bacterium]
MSNPVDLRLYLVTDRQLAGPRGVAETVARAVLGGVTVVQVRSPEAKGRSFVEEARAVKAILKPLNIPLIINDRIDVALAVDADGVHVGQSDIDARQVRAMIGPTKILGLSVGTEAERQASREALAVVDYIGVGAIFATATKPDVGPAVGLASIGLISERTGLPVVAIGGIGLSNAADCIAAGADGVAVVSAIMAAPDPTAAALELGRSIDAALQRRKARS